MKCDLVVPQVDYVAFAETARQLAETKCDSVVLQVDYVAYGAKGCVFRGGYG
ncbi:MAG: hypothetical protein RBR16_13620 [Syntrophus sp. (in: bacteria)]|nr:hypothetical protein [Syntrophus sp. (in: bacteria)]